MLTDGQWVTNGLGRKGSRALPFPMLSIRFVLYSACILVHLRTLYIPFHSVVSTSLQFTFIYCTLMVIADGNGKLL